MFLLRGNAAFSPSLIGGPSKASTERSTPHQNTLQSFPMSAFNARPVPSRPVPELCFHWFPPAVVEPWLPGNTCSWWICASPGSAISLLLLAHISTPVGSAPPGSINPVRGQTAAPWSAAIIPSLTVPPLRVLSPSGSRLLWMDSTRR